MTFSKFCLPFVVINIINNLFHHFFRGTTSMKHLLVSTFIGSVSRLILTIILIQKYGMNGFFAGWILSWFIEAVYSLIIYKSGTWKKNLKWASSE